jgi:hypothetical protein
MLGAFVAGGFPVELFRVHVGPVGTTLSPAAMEF